MTYRRTSVRRSFLLDIIVLLGIVPTHETTQEDIVDKIFLVSQAQRKGWQHPMVRRVVDLVLAMETPQELEEPLTELILSAGFMKPFLPIPFTEDSLEGQKILAAWELAKPKFPHRLVVQEFSWCFWKPDEDLLDAIFTSDCSGTPLTLARTARIEAGVPA